VITWWRIRQTRHVASNGEKRNMYRVWCGNLKKRDRLEVLHVGGRIILK
jgi:hypothetical protein